MRNKGLNESHSIEEHLSTGLNEIWIKRDDLIHPIVSGNKWRKLKYVIQHALENNINHIITYGGAYSNHALATACVCSLFDLKCTIIVRGEEPAEPNHYTLLIRAFNARMVYVSREVYKQKDQVLESLNYDSDRTLVLAEGGAHEFASQGCGEIISVLKNAYDAIFIASGTGTTALGMAKKMTELNMRTELYVMPVLKNESETAELLIEFSNTHVLNNAHLGGYAKTNAELFEGINQMLAQHGIVLDPVYTGKAYIAMLKHIKESKWKGKKVLFIHTGGQLGLFSQPMLKAWANSLG
ncbi:pyridoxal-phosphate dependent enzyme [Bacteroidia bacterium]|nr:pyridoxal-phosphate dependent enzyme [Bacteroidia bacterium]